MGSNVDVSVILPAYNEAAKIFENVIETVQALSRSSYIFEVLVVDDGSTDGTHQSALKAKVAFPDIVRVIRYSINRGKGRALLCGASRARGKFIVFLDADLDLAPEQMLRHLDKLQLEKLDVVIGSKLHPDSIVNYPQWRRVLSYGYFLMVRALFGLPVKDTQTGIKSFRREVLERVAPYSQTEKFAFDLELLSLAHIFGFKIGDAPVRLEFQRGTFGRIRARDIQTIFMDTIKIFFRVRLGSAKLLQPYEVPSTTLKFGDELDIREKIPLPRASLEGSIA